MSIFEHVSVFISIILGLALVHLLGGVSYLLDARERVRTYWVHSLWTANLICLVVLVWLANFVLVEVQDLRVWHILNLIAYSMVIYLMSGLLYPVGGDQVRDFRVHFHGNRARFFILGILFIVTDVLDAMLEYQATGMPLNPGQFATLAIWTVLFGAGIASAGHWLNAIVVIAFSMGLVGFAESLVRYGVVSG